MRNFIRILKLTKEQNITEQNLRNYTIKHNIIRDALDKIIKTFDFKYIRTVRNFITKV